jgi:hypothetical protein
MNKGNSEFSIARTVMWFSHWKLSLLLALNLACFSFSKKCYLLENGETSCHPKPVPEKDPSEQTDRESFILGCF